MLINIIIPAYNAHKTIEQTLFSIAIQDMVKDIKVYIINDASDNDYNEIVKYFSQFLNIEELILDKNSGPGVARQYGLDHSNGKYIIFMDSDDVLSDFFAVNNMVNTIMNGDNDVAITTFVEEGKNQFISYENSHIWLHGKIYKREFLQKNDIRFNDSRVNEDNGFNQLLLLSNAKVAVSSRKTYIWRYNEQSITRRNNNEYRFKGLEGYSYNIIWSINCALERNYDKRKIIHSAFKFLVAMYHYYLEFIELKESKQIILNSKEIYMILKKYEDYISDEEKISIMRMQTSQLFNGYIHKNLLFPKLTFDQFLALIASEVK